MVGNAPLVLPTTTLVRPSDVYLLLIDVVIEAVQQQQQNDRGGGAVAAKPSAFMSMRAGPKKAASSGDVGVSGHHHPFWRELSWILSRKRARIDPLELLGHLPDDVGLGSRSRSVGSSGTVRITRIPGFYLLFHTYGTIFPHFLRSR